MDRRFTTPNIVENMTLNGQFSSVSGIVLGTMFAGGWLMSNHEITAGDLMAFLVATQTIER